MGKQYRYAALSLSEDLFKNPKKYSFEMAAYILDCNAGATFGKDTTIKTMSFKTHSTNSFGLQATEIQNIIKENGETIIYTSRLALAGLNAPLPTPYAEVMFRRNQETDTTITAFFNLFNMRLLGISYRISKRRYLALQNHTAENSFIVKTLSAFCGENPKTMDKKMAKFAFLFWNKEKSKAGLEAILKAFLEFDIKINENITKWYRKKDNVKIGTMKLGINSDIGTKISISSFDIEINLTHKNFEKIKEIVLQKDIKEQLIFLVKKYIGTFINCTFKITPQNVPALKIGSSFLGQTTWLPGSKFDSTKFSYTS